MADTFIKHLFLGLMVLASVTLQAGEADVLDVRIFDQGNNLFRFSVTLGHEDSGWNHYANKWDIISSDGTVLATRTLHHPHVNEQPFTRNLGNITIPAHIKEVIVRGHDSVHGYGGKTLTVSLGR